MKALYVSLSTESPLAVRADHAESGSEMTSYIPGTSFVGALAAVHQTLSSKQSEFSRFFLNDEILFSNLYPANFKSLANTLDLPVYPLPRTAISCKRASGFLNEQDKKTQDLHGVSDSLCDWALFQLGQEKKNTPFLGALQEHKLCHCKESMDRFSGYYRRRKKPSYYREQSLSEHKRLQTRTGINRETGTVEEGILYNRMVFEEDVRFWGRILLPADEKLYSDFFAFLGKINIGKMLRLGTGRTRGLGKVALTFEVLYDQESEEERFAAFQARLHAFDTYLKKLAEKYALINSQAKDHFFAVTLHSPLILQDSLLRYQGQLDAKTLAFALDQEIPGLHLLYQNAGTKRVTGWNDLWGTPKINEFAIEAGSVFLFSHTGTLSEALQRELFRLEEQGLGKRRIEGFGQIRISDEFHNERDKNHG